MSSATRTSRSRPRSTGSSPTRSTPVGCCPVLGSPPVRELGSRAASEPQHDPGRLSPPGRCRLRHESPWRRAPTSPTGRRSDAAPRRSPGIVAEMLRRAAHAGFTADEVAAATFAAATERKRPGPLRPRPLRRVHERRRRLRRRAPGRRLPGHDRGRGRAHRRPARTARPIPLRPRRDDDVPRRRGPGRSSRAACRSWRCSSVRATSSWSTRSPGCRAGRGSGSCAPPSAARTTSLETLRAVGHDRRRDRARR